MKIKYRGRDSVVGTATRYEMDGSGFEPRFEQDILFSISVQPGPRPHRFSRAMGTAVEESAYPRITM